MTQKHAWQGVLLDLDGTLLDTVADLAAAANAMLEAMGRSPLAEATIATFVGKGADNLIARALAGSLDAQKPDPKTFEAAKALFFTHYKANNGRLARLYPGVVEGLQALSDMGLPMAVVTNKPYDYSIPLLEQHNLLHFMQVVVGGDTCPRRKPDAQPILYACQQIGSQPWATLTIGDSINDALAARAAGTPVLAVPYGYNEGAPVTDLPVDGIVTSVFEAANWLQLRDPKPPGNLVTS
jgi:phosphoglycolate phosphatase